MRAKHIVILGAGISGLSTAWFLRQRFKKNIHLTILERESRPGGWIQTLHREGFLFELGPHSFRMNQSCPVLTQLIEGLKLQDQLIAADPSARQRYLFIHQKLIPIPTNPFKLLVSPFGKKIIKGFWKDLWTPKNLKSDESIHDFFTRRLGVEIADQMIDPLVSGIYAGDPKQLSIRSCFPTLYAYEQNHGGLLQGYLARPKSKKGGIFSFKEGMEALPQALAHQLEEELYFSTLAKRLISYSDRIEVELENGCRFPADHVISTLPSGSLNQLLGDESIESIPCVTVQVVNLGYESQVFNNKGFGYLIPSSEKENILGVIWDSSVFPQQNYHDRQTRLTVILKNKHPNDCLNIALAALSKHLSINQTPNVFHIHTAQSAIPQYGIGHEERLKKMRSTLAFTHPRLTLSGSSFYGVSIPDCIKHSEFVAQTIELD